MLTLQRLRQVLRYNAKTGDFTWLMSTSNRVKVGAVAGNASGHDYQRIRIDGQLFYAHRLAVFYMTGTWPKNKVDHRSLSKRDNSWGNLREASNRDNSANVPVSKNNGLGIKGVSRDGKKFRAHITVNGRYRHLGNFSTPDEAHKAYLCAANENFGDFARAV